MNRQALATVAGVAGGLGFLAMGLEWYGALAIGLGLFYLAKDWGRSNA